MWEPGPKPEIDPRHDVHHRVVGYAEFPKRAWLERDGGMRALCPEVYSTLKGRSPDRMDEGMIKRVPL